jgi:serine/threonine-protein kinase
VAAAKPKPKTGKLRVKVMPWADAFVNGEHVGKTPFAPLTLSEGTHSVILVNNELKVRKQYQVKVTAGRETVLRAALQKAP